MIDTNSIIQAGQAAREIKTQINPWLPAIAIAFAWLGRELGHFLSWSDDNIEKIIAHGGLGWILRKFFWNPPASVPSIPSKSTPPSNGGSAAST